MFVLVLAKVLALATAECRLDNKRTAINGVDHSETAWKGVVRPSTCVPECLTTAGNSIIAGEDIEVSDLLNAASIRVAGNGADVEDAQTGLVVGLVCETIVDELVVVDSASSRLVEAAVLGSLEVGDVPDVGGRVAILGDGVGVCILATVDLTLIKLVVHDQVGLPVGVENPALVGVRCTLVRSARDDGRSVEALLVGNIIDGQCVLVVAVADIAAVVLLVRSTVDDALSIVDIAVLGRATLLVRLGDVVDVDENESSSTSVIAASTATTTNSNSVTLLLVGNNVVRTTDNSLAFGKVVEPGSEVLRRIESLRLLRVQLEQLLEVEDLNSVTFTLGTDKEVVTQGLHLVPDDRRCLSRKATKVLELTLLGDLRKSSTIGLTNSNELTSLVRPTPRTRSLRDWRRVAKLLVRLEVIQILR